MWGGWDRERIFGRLLFLDSVKAAYYTQDTTLMGIILHLSMES